MKGRLRERLRDWLGVKAPVNSLPSAAGVTDSLGTVSLAVTANQERAYLWAPWVYAAVNRVAVTAAGAKLNVRRRQGEEETEEINHPLEQLLEHPNPLDSRFSFLESLFGYLALTGEAYVWLNRAEEGAPPDELYILPTRQVRPHSDGRLNIDGYEYYPGSADEPHFLPPWQIMHVKRFNPTNRLAGLSPVAVAQLAIRTDKAQADWNERNFGRYNARTPGVLAFPDPIADSTWERIKAEFYGDSDRNGATRQVMLMRNVGSGTPKWIPTAMNPAEMQFLESRQFNREEIYDIFAPGLAAMTAINATEATARTAKATFIDLTVWPLMVATAEAFTHAILPAYGPNLVCGFDDIRVTDRALALQEYRAYTQHLTINEARQERKEKPLDGDFFDRVPLVVLERLDSSALRTLLGDALGTAMPPAAPPAPAPAPASPASLPTAPTETPGERHLSEPTPPEGLQASAMRAALDDLQKWARKSYKRGGDCDFESETIPPWLNKAVKAGLATHGLAVWSFLKAQPDARDDAEREMQEATAIILAAWLDTVAIDIMAGREPQLERLTEELQKTLYPFLAQIATEVALRLAIETGVEFDVAAVNLAALNWARTYTYDLIKGLNETTLGIVRHAMEQYLSTPGMTQEQLRALLEPAFGSVRASMIATTEVTRAYSQATNQYQQMLEDAGIRMTRVWNTSRDERVCVVCGPLNGKDERVWGEDYSEGPPAHVRCRCWTTLRLGAK